MADKDGKTDLKPAGLKSVGLKSVGSKAPLRSRGFLGQPGGSANPDTGEGDKNARHRSRGARQISANTDNKPQDLTVKPVIKPYRLEDK